MFVDDIDFSRMLGAGAAGVGEGALMEGSLGAAAVLRSNASARRFVADAVFRGKGYRVVGADGKLHDEPGLLQTSEGRMALMKQNPGATERVLDIVEHGGRPRPDELGNRAFAGMSPEELHRAVLADRDNYARWAEGRRRGLSGERAETDEERWYREQEEAEAANTVEAGGEEYHLDELEAREAADAEYDGALAEVERNWAEAESRAEVFGPFEYGRLRTLKAGDALRFDHADATFEVVGFDPDTDVLTLAPQGTADNPLLDDAERAESLVQYEVSENGIREVAKAEESEDGRQDEDGAAEDRAGDEAGERGREALALDGGTAEGAAEEERRRRGRREIERRREAPLKTGRGETGQSLLDLGGAEGEDLFNRTERAGASPSPATVAQPAAAVAEGTAAEPVERVAAGWRVRGKVYGTEAAARAARERERTTFRTGDTVSFEATRDDGERVVVTGTVRRDADGNVAVRVKGRDPVNPLATRYRDVPIPADKLGRLRKLIDGGVRFKRARAADGVESYETNDDIRRLPYRERIRAFRDLMANEYAGRTARFVRDGETYYATFDRDGVQKNLYGDNQSDARGRKAKINVGASGDIFDLVENARYDHTSAETGKSSPAHKGVKSWDYFDKTVRIDGTPFDVLVNVRDKGNSQYVYNVALTENKSIRPGVPQADDSRRNSTLERGRPGSTAGSIPNSGVESNTPAGRQKSAGVAYPDAGAEISGVRFKLGARRRDEYSRILAKHRPDLDAKQVLDEIDKFDNPKKEKVALHWIVRGAIRLPEDGYKIDDALSVAEKAKVDPFRYRSPDELLLAHKEFKPAARMTDPATVPELSDPRDEGDGIVSYLVQDDRAGQLAMRRIIDTHWGADANPWCLLARDADEAALGPGEAAYDGYMDNAWNYWQEYSALPKRVAFKDGRLLAFMATDKGASDEVDLEERLEEMREGLRGANRMEEFGDFYRSDEYYEAKKDLDRYFDAETIDADDLEYARKYAEKLGRDDVLEAARRMDEAVGDYEAEDVGVVAPFLENEVPQYLSKTIDEIVETWNDWVDSESVRDVAGHTPDTRMIVNQDGENWFDLDENGEARQYRRRPDGSYVFGGLAAEEWWDRKDASHPDLDWARGDSDSGTRFKRNAAFDHSLDALQAIADGGEYGVLHNAKYGEVRYPLGRLGSVNAKGGTDGGMGFVHIVSERMRKDGATLEEAIDTAIRVGQAVEAGEETAARKNTRHFDYDGARAIVALTDSGNPVITGYEIRADKPSAAYPSADGRQPLSPDRIKEAVAALRDRIANLRGEGKGEDSGVRFKRGEGYRRAAVDDEGVYFGAKASLAAHGWDVEDAKRLGTAYTVADAAERAREAARDPRRMAEAVREALASDRPLALADGLALAAHYADVQRQSEELNRRIAASANPAAFGAEREMLDAALANVARAVQRQYSGAGGILNAARVGFAADLRDTAPYITEQVRAIRAAKGLSPELSEADRAMVADHARQVRALGERIEELERELRSRGERALAAEAGGAVDAERRRARAAAPKALSSERRARAERLVGEAISDAEAAALGSLDEIFGGGAMFKAGDVAPSLTDDMAARFAAYVEANGGDYAKSESKIAKLYPKAAPLFAEFRRAYEGRPAPTKAARAALAASLGESREAARRAVGENPDDGAAVRRALGRHLRKFMRAVVRGDPSLSRNSQEIARFLSSFCHETPCSVKRRTTSLFS